MSGAPAGSPGDVAEDSLLGGRVRLLQPRAGYRVAIDPVLLAAAVAAVPGESVLDVGSGVGAAALCLAARVEGVRVAGVEADRALVRLAVENVRLNGLSGRVDVMAGDLLRPPARLAAASFDHVIANPPYAEAGTGTPPPDPGRRAATVEGEAALGHWLDFCLLMARAKGTLTVIHRADRLDRLLALMGGRVGDIVVFPLWPGPADGRGPGPKPAKRVIVAARKGTGGPLRLAPGLVLHGPGGAYTAEAEAVLRHGRALEI